MTHPKPSPILAGGLESFAHSVFHNRHPKLVDSLVDVLPYGPTEHAGLQRLLTESIAGAMEPLTEDTPDREQWQIWGEDFWGKPWSEVPFLWAESYFYRRLLEATGYFKPGPWHGIDPFAPAKKTELASPTVADQLNALRDLAPLTDEQKNERLLSASLWGNRADLGFRLTTSITTEPTGLLVDEQHLLWSTLTKADHPTLHLVADNAAGELLSDLALVDHLLDSELASEAVVWVKPHPYYVSDATMTDVITTIGFLRAAPQRAAAQIGQRLHHAMRTGQLEVRTHDFFCAPLPFTDMPVDLVAEFSQVSITVLKGDLNYRRLVQDLHWPATTTFGEATHYFPSQVLALRTLKSDVVVGLTAKQVAELDAAQKDWRTNGEHALIQARRP